MKADPLSIIESAYVLDGPVDAWLGGVLHKLADTIGTGLGVWAVLYDARDAAKLKFEHMAFHGIHPLHEELLRGGAETLSRKTVEKTFVSGTCGTLSESVGDSFRKNNPIARAVKETFGVGDAIGINAMDPTLRGCMLSVSLPEARRTSSSFKARWQRIAAHVAAGHRLRRQLEAAAQTVLAGAEAVLDPDGKVQHADGDAKDAGAREALRGAAVAIDRLRTRAARTGDADGAIQGWKGLVSGRWSLVDHFERDGRRFFVARRNDPRIEPGALTLRELQVAGFAALGHSNKLIGYEMGLSESTVATHLMRAAKKLGVRSRAGLIRHFRAQREAAADSTK